MDTDEIKRLLADAGVFKSGVASLSEPVGPESILRYNRWIADGRHATMSYLEKYPDLRRDPRRLLEGAQSLISCAFNYYYPPADKPSPLKWASYALGDDYHDVIRERLGRVTRLITSSTGAECRICVDTAPLRERYWAVRAGLGFIGLNNQLIIPGAGSRFFLGEIITTLPLAADSPCTQTCGGCRRCIDRCPGKALDTIETVNNYDGRSVATTEGRIDSRKCLSYLTIEHRGPLPEGLNPGRRIYGCDECQDACPHNADSPVSTIHEFRPRPEILRLTAADISAMNQEEFSSLFRRSAIKRAKLAGLQRNAAAISPTPNAELTQ